MKSEDLKLILEKHSKWLRGEEGGERASLRGANLSSANLSRANLSSANLSSANLSSANLSHADLSRANLDYSCWPLWCGSLGVKGDEALVGQLLFHVFDFARSSGVDVSSVMKIRNAIKKSSPITKHKKEVPI